MKKKHLRVLDDITKSIPKELIEKLTKTVPMFETLKEIATRALTDDSVAESDKDRFRTMLASGYLDKTEEVIDEEIEKQINDYVEAEIEKAIKLKRLPKKPSKLNHKGKQNVRRNQEETVN